jgi:hypothetical protein
LRQAALELVQSSDDFVAGLNKRYQRRWRGAHIQLGVACARARIAYCEKATASSDPFHQHLATLFENDTRAANFVDFAVDVLPLRILKNWLREEPHLETQPAHGWVTEDSQRVEFARVRPIRSYTATIPLEIKQSFPPATALCVDVGTEVAIANVSLDTDRGTKRKTDWIWKRSRVWVFVDEPPLDEGDRLSITVSSANPLAQSTSLRVSAPPR